MRDHPLTLYVSRFTHFPNLMTWPDNKQLFRWHGWLGLNFGLLLFVVCFSGTIAVFSYEIDGLIDPDMQVEPQPDAPAIDWTAMHDSVRATLPYHAITLILKPRHRGFAAHVLATDPAGRSVKIYVHPQTGKVLREANFWNVQRFFRSFHRRMFVPGTYGIVWVTMFALVLLGSAVTGIVFYRGWYRHLFRLRWRDARLLFSDGHRLAGVWSLAFAAIIVVTSVWYFTERFAPATTPGVPDVQPEAVADRGPVVELLPLDEQIRIAKAAYPGFEVEHVWPGTPAHATELRGQAEAWFVRPRANRVRVHPVTGDVALIQRAMATPAYQRWSNMADPLHFGTFGGLWTQVLWFVCGLVLSSLSLTGGWLWHLRAEKKARTAGASRHPRWSYVAAALPIAVLLVSSVLGYMTAQIYMKPEAAAHSMAQHTVGPWEAHVTRRGPIEAGRDVTFAVYLFAEGGAPNIQRAALRLADPDGASVAEADVAAAQPLTATLTLPSHTDPALLTFGAELVTGAVTHTLRAPLSETIGTPALRVDRGPADVPTPVWLVIGLFVVITLAITGAWLYLAQRTARRRNAEASSPPPDTKPAQTARRPVAVTADLPSPG